MVASKKEIHKYNKYTINKSERRYKQYMQYRLLYHNIGLSIAIEIRSKLRQPQDRSTFYKISFVNLIISVKILLHVFPILHSVIQN